MASAEPRSTGRETRLLLVTIGVSVAALVLLARFRFPEQAAPSTDPAPAPLQRLAARAAFDELASAMIDIERRISPRLLVFRVRPQRASGAYVVAPRVTVSRAAAVLGEGESLESIASGLDLVVHDPDAGVAVLNVPAIDEAVVTPSASAPRSTSRYVVVVEGTSDGPTFRPVYVGRTTMSEQRRGPLALLTMDGLQAQVSRGAAIFTLDGTFLGLVSTPGTLTAILAADSLRAFAGAAQPVPARAGGDLGVLVQNASEALLRAAAANRGVVVTHVRPEGPAAAALRPGDVIESVDELETSDIAAFRRAARSRVPGEPTTVRFVRHGSAQQVTFRARDAALPPAVGGLGLDGRSVPGIGVEVVAVAAGGSAAGAGLRRGDLILTLGGEPLADLGRLARAYRAAREGSGLILSIARDDQHLVTVVEKR